MLVHCCGAIVKNAGGKLSDPSIDEKQIHALFDAGDRALMAADLGALAQIFADDYVQYDPSGQPFTKQQVLDNLRRKTVGYPSIVSTGRTIRLFGDFAIVHGSEDDIVETVRRNGGWQIVASLLAKPDAA
jgi:ketosteroid isomerase-like protein